MTDFEFECKYLNRKVRLKHTSYIYTIVGTLIVGKYDNIVVRDKNGASIGYRLDQLELIKEAPLPLPG